MDLQLAGRRVLVTGGGRGVCGISRAVARALALEGCDVALRASRMRSPPSCRRPAGGGRPVVGVVADTTCDASMVQATRPLGGDLRRLVDAAGEPAGYAEPPELADLTAEHFHAVPDTKVTGCLRCAREVVLRMQVAGWGRIVCVGGLAARQAGNTVGSIRNVAVAAR